MTEEDDDWQECGNVYDHDLPEGEWIDGCCVVVCRSCGGELILYEDEE